jgi:5-methylcytosine-specific restriction endonuclease McrA
MINPQHKKGKKPKKRRKFIPKTIVTRVFERDDFTCQYCDTKHMWDNHSLHCHHIVRTSQGGQTTIKNLLTLCWVCHRLLHDGKIKMDKK